MKVRLFSGKLLFPFAAFLLLAVSDLSSSSSSRAEDGFWFAHSQSSLEQLWSGVMGCADVASPPPPPPPNQYIRDRLDDDSGSSVPTGTSSDYSQCGKLALRNTGSRILVDTIEDAVRSGGVALFNENFHLDSSVGWVWDEKVSGAFDAVVPLFSRERTNGLGYAFFLQPGGVFWQGLKEQDRIDGNLGLAFRSNLTPDVIAGASVFYDHDFRRGHQRAGVGVDLQSGALHTALNYYHPLNDWQEGRTDYEEQPLQGADFRLGLAWSRIRFDTSVAVWRFEREEEESTKWRPAFGIDAGYRILPGVFLEGGYESHDSDDSLDSRWNAGFAFRFSLPGLEGIKSYETMAEANLWEPVAREKRILYEEREAIPPVRLAAPTDESGEELTGLPEEGATITIPGELVALPEAIMLELAIDEEDSSAVLGEDFSYGHAVYELNAETGEQSAPDTVTDCPMATCQMMIPAGVSRFDVEIEILDDDSTAPREIPEEIVLQVNVPEEYQRMVRGGATTVGIQAHGNTVQFTEATSTLDENGGVTNVEVNANLASPSPITLDVTVTSTDAVLGTDYTIPSGSRLTIPANPDGEITSASLTLDGIDNNVGEGSKTITLTIPDDQSLPTGWTLGTQTTHTVTLQDDDLAIFFTEATRDRVDEPASDQSFTVTVGITQAPSVDIAVVVAAGGTGETASSSDDYTFTATELTFRSGMTAPQTATLTLLADTGTEAEPDEFIVLTLADKDDDATARNTDGFSLDGPHTVTIAANDNTVGFASNAVATLRERENNETVGVDVSISHAAPEDITLNVSVNTTTSTATEGTDFTLSPPTLTIPRGQTSGTITLTSINNNRGEGSKRIDLTLSVSGSLPTGWAEGDLEHEVTLQDDDLSIFFTSATRSRVEEPVSGGTPVTITVGITQAPTAEIKVMVAAGGTGQTAQAADYTFPATELTFPASGTAAQTATLMVLQDSVAETDDETIVLTLTEVSGLTTGGNNFSLGGSHTITIPKNGNTVAFASGTSTLTEGAGTMTQVTVNVVEPAPEAITLNITPTGSATEGRDYETLPDSLTIGANQSSGTITIRGREDGDGEGDETIMLEISLPQGSSLPDGWTLGMQTTHIVTIKDNDLSISFVTDPSLTPHTPSEVEEPARTSGTTVTDMVTIAVGINQPPTAELKVIVGVDASSTATQSGNNFMEDYNFGGDTLTFPAGMITTQTTTLTIVNTGEREAMNETIVLMLTDDSTTQAARIAGGFSLGGPHTITIPANDNVISFGTDASTLAEEDGTTATVSVNIADPAPNDDIILDIAVTGTATENEDYTINTKRLTIGANQSSGTITLESMEDSDIEGGETIVLEISEPSGSPWPRGWDFGTHRTHTVTILDDDLKISFVTGTGNTPSEVEEPGTGNEPVTVKVKIDRAPTNDIIVRVSDGGPGETALGDPVSGTDYTFAGGNVTFTNTGALEQTLTATFNIHSDTVPEDDEFIVLTLADGSGTQATRVAQGFSFGANHTITIPANDPVMVGFAGTASNHDEDSVANVRAGVVVTPGFSQNITVGVRVLTGPGNSTAVAGMDYMDNIPGTITISAAAGMMSASENINISVIDDSRVESTETIVLEIFEPEDSTGAGMWPPGVVLGANTMHTISINDDDVPSTVSFSTPSDRGTEGSSFAVRPSVNVSPTFAQNIKVGVRIITADSTADENDDFTVSSTVTVAANNNSSFLQFSIIDDDDDEPAETVVLEIYELSGADELPPGVRLSQTETKSTYTIQDDDVPANTIGINANHSNATANEGTSPGLIFEIADNLPSAAEINVAISVDGVSSPSGYTLTDPNAGQGGGSFDDTNNVVTIDAGTTGFTLLVTVPEDNANTTDETITLTLTKGTNFPSGWDLGSANSPTTWTIMVNDND